MAAHGLLGEESHCHQIFAHMMASQWLGSLRPMPPFSLGIQVVVHFTKAHLRFVAALLHRKLHCRVLMHFKTHLGTARIENKYRGIAYKTDLMRMIRLAKLRDL